MKKGGLLLAAFALAAYWPVLDAHPLMDDHLFFSWLEQTPWKTALSQRFAGNWIPYFTQMQMYRPLSGLVQVLNYKLFGPHPLAHHLFSLLLHGLTSLLAGRLAYRLSQDSRTGWCTAGILLLHPRAALGVSLIFNFHDQLASCLMLAALLCLWSLKQDNDRGRSPLRLVALWVCIGLALGVKELALPIVVVLVLADWLWLEGRFTLRGLLVRHTMPVLLLVAYLWARTKAVGHPFRTHSHPSAFPLPDHAELWAFFWDFLLLAFCAALAGFLNWALKRRGSLNNEAPWMVLWSGFMLLPAVHFCSQVTLHPWFFDERYWYVPLAPLSVLAGSCLTRGGWVNACLGAAVLAFTLPGWLGVYVATLTLMVAGPLRFCRLHLEVQRVTGVLFAASMALGTLKQCQAIRLRADEAAGVHQAVAQAVSSTPAGSLMAFLNFSETSVEREGSFNGDLQFLLQPPFFPEDLNQCLFFSYSTWDSPPSNRFRDRTTATRLTPNAMMGLPVNVFRWNELNKTLNFIGEDSWLETESTAHPPLELAMRPGPLHVGRAWRAENLTVNPKVYRYVSINVILNSVRGLDEKALALHWASQPSGPFESVRLTWPKAEEWPSTGMTVWLHPGHYVDWLLSGTIRELVLEMPRDFDLATIRLSSVLPAEVAKKAKHINHYRNPATKFEWIGESWWVVGD